MIDITRMLQVPQMNGDNIIFDIRVNLITNPNYVILELSNSLEKTSMKCILHAEQAHALSEILRQAALEADSEPAF